MTPSPSIAIVICTYNHAALLDRALTALARQKEAPGVVWSVLVVDNNCTDETPAVVARHQRRGEIPSLSRVAEPEQGLTPARRCGVLNTTADWIAFVDDDCLLREDWVAQAARFARRHPDCGAFGGRVVLDWETPPPPFVETFTYSFAEQDHGSESQPVSFLAGAGLVVRRAALNASGWTDEPLLADRVGDRLVSGGDVEIALRIRGTGHALWYAPACVLDHFIPSQRLSLKYLQGVNRSLGISQVYADALVWRRSYAAWLAATVFQTLGASLDVLWQAARGGLRHQSASNEVTVRWSFEKGRWAGLQRMIRMDRSKRRALLGRARPRRGA